ncbi:aminoglycoside phosphotransferase family protein [Sediminibacillus albus]|uniref:Streptomycin 6-kinase n=1 Tax=Sediminibacillus albus TaxID=407036 RepID=A0A1G8WYK9_9BACI|nr:aminoglycoside phosphotransferase family protein [Sediminibacillus albus]SDJ83294.1 streptomycin 6-kinase [Sediminibacillus albus]
MQQQFVKNIKLYFREEGEAWLAKLPNIIRYCEQKWQLIMHEPYQLSINYVAPARMADGTKAVVKISPPGGEFIDQLEALQSLRSPAMVNLIDYEAEYGIMLLEQVLPGTTLADIEDHALACRIAADVHQKITVGAPPQTKLPSTEVREAGLRKIARNHPKGIGPISEKTLENALGIFAYLNQTIKKHWLLHGDFHHYNLLRNGESWLAIDPKGLIGEREYDLIQFLLNKLPEEGSYWVIETRTAIFTRELQLNKERLLLWGFCHSVLATCWTVDEDGRYEQGFYQAIGIFEHLYKQHFGRTIEDIPASY